MTEQGRIGEQAVLASINELYPRPVDYNRYDGLWANVMEFNDDPDTTFEMIEQVVKLGMIKLETGWEPTPEFTRHLELVKKYKV